MKNVIPIFISAQQTDLMMSFNLARDQYYTAPSWFGWNSFSCFQRTSFNLPFLWIVELYGCDKLNFDERNANDADKQKTSRYFVWTSEAEKKDPLTARRNVTDKLVTLFRSNGNQFVVCVRFFFFVRSFHLPNRIRGNAEHTRNSWITPNASESLMWYK